MLTTDFTGTYDYEREEAKHAASYILDDVYDGYINPEELPFTLEKERQHWKKHLPDTFEDFDKHFIKFISEGLEHALKGYQLSQEG